MEIVTRISAYSAIEIKFSYGINHGLYIMKTYFNNLAHIIDATSIGASFNEHRPDTGANREEILIEILNNHIPHCLTAINGGNIINIEGEKSKQIDVIIKNNLFPKFEQYKKTSVITESVVGVISVKSFLDKKALEESIENVASVPKFSKITLSLSNSSLQRTGLQEEFTANWPYRAIFAYGGIDPDTLYRYALEYYNAHPTRLADFPDMIVINKHFCIRHLANGEKLSDGTLLPKKYLHPVKLTSETQGYPIAGIITQINNYIPWMHYMKCNFSPYIDRAYAS